MKLTCFNTTRRRHGRALLAMTAVLLLAPPAARAADPAVTNVTSMQRAGTKLVDITYDVSDADEDELQISVVISSDNGGSFVVPASALSEGAASNSYPTVTFPAATTSLTGRTIVWDAGVDFNQQFNSQMVVRVIANDGPVPTGMALVPAGAYDMGDSTGAGFAEEFVHSVTVSGFYIDIHEVTEEIWDSVHDWAMLNGYNLGGLPDRGAGNGPKHPAKNISWYQALKWCNARSEKEDLTPAYYTDATQTAVYRTGLIDLAETSVNWTADGYRLPTEAEWERASRGGLAGLNFPWGGSSTPDESPDFNHGNANYHPLQGYFAGTTSPAGYYAANGYGIADSSGNVWEWCWDAYSSSYYFGSPSSDPRGPAFVDKRVFRGGSFSLFTLDDLRCAKRNSITPGSNFANLGFRTVRGL